MKQSCFLRARQEDCPGFGDTPDVKGCENYEQALDSKIIKDLEDGDKYKEAVLWAYKNAADGLDVLKEFNAATSGVFNKALDEKLHDIYDAMANVYNSTAYTLGGHDKARRLAEESEDE